MRCMVFMVRGTFPWTTTWNSVYMQSIDQNQAARQKNIETALCMLHTALLVGKPGATNKEVKKSHNEIMQIICMHTLPRHMLGHRTGVSSTKADPSTERLPAAMYNLFRILTSL